MQNRTIREIAVEVLRNARVPLHVTEITAQAQRRGAIIKSATPEKTVNNALQKDDRVERVGPALFRFTEPETERSPGRRKGRQY